MDLIKTIKGHKNMVRDLTIGKPESILWRFSIPMFVSVIFQQVYNIADSVIAGKYAGEDALAAVGASYPITMIFMAIAIGSNIGCSVVISNYFGAKKMKELKTAVSTTLITTCILSVTLTLFGLLLHTPLMKMIQTPENIFRDGSLYLQIYFVGFLFLYLYNVCTGIFSSLGDSMTPLLYLIGSSIGNIVLDYLFVAKFHWGVAGVAWATFIAQGVACILALLTLYRRICGIKTEGRITFFSVDSLSRIGRIAIPSILQQSFVSIGNIFIQRIVNGYGSSVIAGYSAAIKLNTFAITSFSTLGNGLSSFSAQNLGAGKYDRIRRGYRAGIILTILVAVPFFVLYFFCGNTMIHLFMKEDSRTAVAIGRRFLQIVSPFYFVICIKLMADGVLRGTGNMMQFMISTFMDLILRVALAYLFSPIWKTDGIWYSWPVGWLVALLLSVGFYHRLQLFRQNSVK